MASGHLAYDSLDVDGHVYFVYEGVVFFTDGERAHWVDGVLDGEPPDAYAWCHEVAALLMEEAGNIAERRWHLRQAARHCERAEMTRAALVLADLCLVPVGASVAEIWATSDVLELVEQAKKVRPVDVRMVWTRHRPHTKLAKELTALATQELGLPILKTALALRVAYPEALGSGLTVAEMPDANAKAELRELVAEVRKIIR